MTMGETLPLAEVMAHLSELVGRVANQHERATVTVHGRPSAVWREGRARLKRHSPKRCAGAGRLDLMGR
ncbi:MAG: type II toxin-antitoxin system Phd/YefM family antitoxin [Nocardioidaceae bacterium]|nr:type II toxin-antitoxin system Phd/YefM family antitoxin [Nocardioidaceae bacterium]